LAEYPLAEILTLADGRTVEWEAAGAGPPLMWVEGGPGLWAHLARPDVELMADLFCCHLVNAPGCGRTSPPADISGYNLPGIIAFFEEVRRHGIEPIMLFLVDQDPSSAQAYAILQRWFANVPLLPVRNEAKGMPDRDAFPKIGAVSVSPDMWTLRAMSTALIDKPTFSFAKFWQKAVPNISDSVDEELRSWMKWIFFQFRQIELCQMCEDVLSMIETPGAPLAPTPPPRDPLDPQTP